MITPAELERMKTPDTTIGGYSKPKEDAHVALIDSIGNGEPFGLVPLDRRGDPDLIGLVVGGELRAEYRKVAYHPAGSGAAALILARIINEMFDRLAAIRNLNSGLKSAGAVPRSVESEPADDAPAAEFETPWAGEVEQPEPETLPNVPVEPDSMPCDNAALDADDMLNERIDEARIAGLS